MKKILIIMFLIIINTKCLAIDWTGPGSSCGATLQSCITLATDGDIINLKTNVPIEETLTISSAISLIATDGYTPTFSEGNSILIESDGNITIKGLTLLDGKISVLHQGSGSGNYRILNNSINIGSVGASNYAIRIRTSEAHAVDLIAEIKFNQITSKASGIFIFNDFNDIEISSTIYGNTINSTSTANTIINGSSNTIDLNFIANKILSRKDGLRLQNSDNDGDIRANIISNLFNHPESSDWDGLHMQNITDSTGVINAKVINNTFVNGFYGVMINDNSGTINANLYNNLVAYQSEEGFNFELSNTLSSIQNDYNLTFDTTAHSNYIPGANALIEIDPQLDVFNRLTNESAAIDAGSPIILSGISLPYVDADGLHREKDGNGDESIIIDIGAYEYGQLSFTHTHKDLASNGTAINHPSTNNKLGLESLHVTSNYHVEESSSAYNRDGSGVYNPDNIEIVYDSIFSKKWRIRNTGAVDILPQAAFNILNIPNTITTFTHKQSSISQATLINRSGLAGHSDKSLQVSQHREFIGVDNPHPIGVNYSSGNWYVLNLDFWVIPINTKFNIYYQDKSQSAWEHIATNTNINFNKSYLNHPLLNGTECANIQVTQSASQGILNDKPIGVIYDTVEQKWQIFNQPDPSTGMLQAMPEGAAFHVLIDPAQIDQCSDVIFKNGFNS